MKTTKFLSFLLICLSVHFTAVADNWTTYEKDSTIYTLVMDSSNNVWYGSKNNYVSKFDGNTWSVATKLSCRYIGSAFTDKAGNVWIPSNGGGAYKYKASTSINYNSANIQGLADDFYAGMEDKSGNIWLTSLSAGIFKYDGTTWTNYNVANNGLAGDRVYSVAQDSIGNIWVGTTLGVSKYDGNTWTTYTKTNGLLSNYAYCLCVDKAGNLWIGSNDPTTGGLTKYDGTTWTTYTATNSPLISNNVEYIFQDKKENLWFLTDDGVSMFDGVNWKTYTAADGLVDNAVYSGFQDPTTGDLWFGTNKGISKLTIFSATPNTISLKATADTTSFKISTYKNWELLSSNWLTLSVGSGSGDSTVTLTVAANTGTSALTGSVVLTGTGGLTQIITVTQAPSIVTSLLETKQAVSISPNPVKDAFLVTGIEGTATLTLSDINGKLLQTKLVTANEAVSVNSLPKGVYVVKLTTLNGTTEQKLIKQ